MLGLREGITTCLFDLDGVLTDTASVHFAAWKGVFDRVLDAQGQGEQPFTRDDYDAHVDGEPREAGVRGFLASRGIDLPEGAEKPGGDGDSPPEDLTTVAGVGRAKNDDLLARIARDGVDVFEGSRRYLQAAADAGLARAVVSSSANTEQVLRVTGLAGLVQVRVDGVTLRERRLAGKPAPDSFLAAARQLGAAPGECVVFEDALAGAAAGRAGAFGEVVGVDRSGGGPDGEHAAALREHGADTVVADLSDLLDL